MISNQFFAQRRSAVRPIVTALMAASMMVAAPMPAQAIEVSKYDQLSAQDKGRYLESLINGSEQLLRSRQQDDMANKIVDTFWVMLPGKKYSQGMEQFTIDLEAGRRYEQRTGKALEVEQVMLVTFKKFGIEVPKSDVMIMAKDFKPTSVK